MKNLALDGRSPGWAASDPPAPTFDGDEVKRFQDFFYRKTGIVFGDAKGYFVDRRLADRIAATKVESLRAYLLHLKFDDRGGTELQHLINSMTVNETYFYREEYQFLCLVTSILPEVVARRTLKDTQPVRLWSLPCSTGEEPYSLAIQLLENWRDVDRYDLQIVASDIDTKVLAQARAGLYDDRSVQHLSAAVKARYFSHTAAARWQIIDGLRTSVDFVPVNLNDQIDMRRHRGAYDVIFCRNLLIYFDDVSRRQAADALFDSLRPGGFVCLGHSESMSRMSSLFTVRKFPDAIVYQKPFA
jgi:chemotaxis protein methyltransferase CheR